MERSAAQQWLLSRVDRGAVEAVMALLRRIAEQLATATADGVSIRRLSADGRLLVPMAAHHPEPERGAALAAAMGQTMDRDGGLWQSVIDGARPVRWHVPSTGRLPDANQAQAQFLARFPVRAILAAPLVANGAVVGGVSLVRFGSDVPYTAADEALLTACARRIAAVLRFLAEIEGLAGAPS